MYLFFRCWHTYWLIVRLYWTVRDKRHILLVLFNIVIVIKNLEENILIFLKAGIKQDTSQCMHLLYRHHGHWSKANSKFYFSPSHIDLKLLSHLSQCSLWWYMFSWYRIMHIFLVSQKNYHLSASEQLDQTYFNLTYPSVKTSPPHKKIKIKKKIKEKKKKVMLSKACVHVINDVIKWKLPKTRTQPLV